MEPDISTQPNQNPRKRAIAILIVALFVCALGAFLWWMFKSDSAAAPTQATTRPLLFGKVKDLQHAIEKGDTEKVKQMLAANPDLIKTGDEIGAIPLHTAAWNGKPEIAAMLINLGSQLEVKDRRYKSTPTEWAIVAGEPEAVQVLLAGGAKAPADYLETAEEGIRGEFKDFSKQSANPYIAVAKVLRDAHVPETNKTRFQAALHFPDQPIIADKTTTAPLDFQQTESNNHLLSSMTLIGATAAHTADGIELTTKEDHAGLVTSKVYSPPLTITADVMTDSNNIRLYFGFGEAIFNWEKKPTELRLIDPSDHKWFAVAMKGKLEPKKFHHIQWIVTPTQMRLVVDNEERYTRTADYSKTKGRVAIGPAWKSKLTIKKLSIE